jgi:integrase
MSKRANGEGTIYKRSDGRWCASITLPKGKRQHFLSNDREEVARQLTAAKKKRDEGLPIINDRQTVSEFLNRWLKDRVTPSARRSTIRGYESKIRIHIIPEIGTVQLSRLTPQRLQSFLNDRLHNGLSPRTVHHLRAILRAALSDAMKWGLVARNVADLVDPPRVPHEEVQVLSPDEAQQLLAVVQGNRLEALYSVALALGLRQGEALGLRWEDIDFDAGTLRVRRSLQRIGGAFEFVEPKTVRSHRTLALPNVAAVALREHRTRQLSERLAAGPMWEELGLVFTRQSGKPLYGSNVTRDFQRMLERAGLRRLRFHDMRHACASLLIAQGVHPRIVMETLGHSQIGITMNLYGHVLPDVQRQAATQMDAVLARRG